jgi:predicted transcriptional regulator
MARKTTSSTELRCPNCGTKIFPSPKEMKQWRISAGLTQRQLAERLGISAAHVAYLESGRRMPSASLIQRYWKFGRKTKQSGK